MEVLVCPLGPSFFSDATASRELQRDETLGGRDLLRQLAPLAYRGLVAPASQDAARAWGCGGTLLCQLHAAAQASRFDRIWESKLRPRQLLCVWVKLRPSFVHSITRPVRFADTILTQGVRHRHLRVEERLDLLKSVRRVVNLRPVPVALEAERKVLATLDTPPLDSSDGLRKRVRLVMAPSWKERLVRHTCRQLVQPASFKCPMLLLCWSSSHSSYSPSGPSLVRFVGRSKSAT